MDKIVLSYMLTPAWRVYHIKLWFSLWEMYCVLMSPFNSLLTSSLDKMQWINLHLLWLLKIPFILCMKCSHFLLYWMVSSKFHFHFSPLKVMLSNDLLLMHENKANKQKETSKNPPSLIFPPCPPEWRGAMRELCPFPYFSLQIFYL